jgi:alkyl hydroperoxide reductase subunit AhpF
MTIFRPTEEEKVRELFGGLARPVELVVAPGPEETPLVRIVEELVAFSELLSLRIEDDGFERYPALAVSPEGQDKGVRFYGVPWGYELGSLVGAVVEAGRAESSLEPESLERLDALDRELAIDVFVTPT